MSSRLAERTLAAKRAARGPSVPPAGPGQDAQATDTTALEREIDQRVSALYSLRRTHFQVAGA